MVEAALGVSVVAVFILAVLLFLTRLDKLDWQDKELKARSNAEYYHNAWNRADEQVRYWERKHQKVAKLLGLEIKEGE